MTLHNPSEFPCQQMVRDVWRDAAIQDFVREELVFMFLTSGTSEAERYRQYYPFSEYPHWALIDPRTGKRVKSGNKTLRAPEMLMELVEYVSEHSLQSPKRRNVPDAAADDGSHLSGDGDTRAGKSPKLSPVEKPVIPQEKAEETPGEAITHGNKAEEIPGEPAADDPDAITVQFRLPDGTRQRRRFLSSRPIQQLFDFVRAAAGPAGGDFDIQAYTKSLDAHRDELIADHSLRNASLSVIPKEQQPERE